jgi:hypothetical protein
MVVAGRLFLHVGAMKSGTSYLQALCTDNRERLEAAGLRWVRASEEDQAAHAADYLRTGQSSYVRNMRRRLAHASRDWDGDLLLSMELLGPRDAEFQRRLIEAAGRDDVHVVVSGRDLAQIIPSRWQTTVRTGRGWTWTEYVSAVCSADVEATPAGKVFWAHQDLARMLRNWSTVTTRDRMHVVTVPPPPAESRELWRRFAVVLGIDPAGYRQPDGARANRSISLPSVEVLRRVNHLVDDLDYVVYRKGFGGPAGRVFGSRQPEEPRLQIPEAHRDWVEERARRMNAEIVELGVRVVGSLDDLLPSPADPDAVEAVAPTPAELLDAAVDGFAALGRSLAMTRLELEALRHRQRRWRRRPDWRRRLGRLAARRPRLTRTERVG